MEVDHDPSWQGIPEHFKRNVVQLLDLKSRSHLQICSQTDKQLVDKSPTHLRQIFLEIQNHGMENKYKTSLLFLKQGRYYYTKTNVANRILNVFKRKRSTVDELIIVCSVQMAFSMDDNPMVQVFNGLRALGGDFKLKVRKISLNVVGLEQYSLGFLQLCDPSRLKIISLEGEVRERTLRQMIQTPAWQNAKRIKLKKVGNVTVPSISHMEHIVMCAVEFKESDVNDLILNFTRRQDVKPGQGFHLRHFKHLKCREIACLDIPYVSEEEEERLRTRRRIVTQTFPTTNPRLTFQFKVGGRDTAGYVCRTRGIPEPENRRRRNREQPDEFEFYHQHFDPTGHNQRRPQLPTGPDFPGFYSSYNPRHNEDNPVFPGSGVPTDMEQLREMLDPQLHHLIRPDFFS